MILILGGTTEGRKAVAVCDTATKPYYYSTKGDLQKIDSAYGIRLTGGMDDVSMSAFCKKNNIRLIIDAAHPFAENLHQNVAKVSSEHNIPVVRFERNYPDRDKHLLWFDTYKHATNYLIENKIDDVLALTGVNTIAKLKQYWQLHSCWFRILNREESLIIAQKEGFPPDKIILYSGEEDEFSLFETLKPKAIITKESGKSGGFDEKIRAANKLNIPVLVIKRPVLSPSFISVFGEHGLRKQIENIVADFFELRTGYTSGTCATAATKSALISLLTKEIQPIVTITLPNGEQIKIPITSTSFEKDGVKCSVIKDAGDDPDVTNGLEISSFVRLSSEHTGVRFLQGEGVGTVTLPGLDIKIGEPAINKTPRIMIRREIFKVFRHYQHKLPCNNLKTGVDVIISVPKGKEIALRTFNPKLGITGGISIIGTSGVVKPFSSEAFISSICREMQVAKALKCNHIIINSGAKSEKFIQQLYPLLPAQAFIHYGNFIGETIKIAANLKIKNVTMGLMIGKAVKLAEGSLDTHSKKVVMNKDFLIQIANEANCSESTISKIREITMARQLWDIIPNNEDTFFLTILRKCYNVCTPLLPDGTLKIILIDESGKIITL